ncbi:MAG TPA: TlyA family RNA methyltransferase [Pilimelia sp.]|nr:TlyA family RNA methyltransferase [Pilimelia sp.]
MARRIRLDAELVRRGLARSREQAAALIHDGRVQVAGLAARKPAAMVDPAAAVRVLGEDPRAAYVSRGAHKLAGALAAFGPRGLAVAGRRCLDAGASTGGFTDVLLRAGAAEVAAVDVGYGQLAWILRNDPRVRVFERTNVRTLTPEAIGGPASLTVADLSFISLRLVLPALHACTAGDGDLALMVKPQFEVGRQRVGPGGVVRDARLRAEAVADVAEAAAGLGLGVAGVVASPLSGPSGNVEFFVWFRRGAPPVDPDEVARVVAGVPEAGAAPRDGYADGVAR